MLGKLRHNWLNVSNQARLTLSCMPVTRSPMGIGGDHNDAVGTLYAMAPSSFLLRSRMPTSRRHAFGLMEGRARPGLVARAEERAGRRCGLGSCGLKPVLRTVRRPPPARSLRIARSRLRSLHWSDRSGSVARVAARPSAFAPGVRHSHRSTGPMRRGRCPRPFLTPAAS